MSNVTCQMSHVSFVFFGTDDFSVIVLEELKRAGFLPSLVVTVPNKPKGRGLALASPLVKIWAQKNKIAFLQLEKLDATSTILLASKIVECFVVASYGKIIPKAILDIPKYGALNVHPSLLPKYRGASPIESQILANEKEIGVTIMLMDEKMDHGPVVAQQRLEFSIFNFQFSRASELRKKLAEIGGKLLAETLPKWVAGEIQAVPQDESKATYTKKFTKVDGEINLSDDRYQNEAERRRRAYKNFLKIRAFDGSVRTYFYVVTTPPSDKNRRPPLEQSGVPKERKIRVIIKDAKFENGALVITRVIPEGKREMRYVEFLRELRIKKSL